MSTSTRPDSPAYRAAARRNFIIFTVVAVFGVGALITGVALLLV
jgi:hypothetical protein